MAVEQERTLKGLPSLPPLLLRAALSRRKPGEAPRFPTSQLKVADIKIDETQLRHYAASCGFPVEQHTLPLTYLHILAFRLQMQMMLLPDFPVAAMGCIHLRNTIHQYRAIDSTERITLCCRIEHDEITDRGYEFSFLCQAFAQTDDGSLECVWEDHSLYLSRKRSSAKKGVKETRPEPRQYPEQREMTIQRKSARRYARASGDFNPIHLHDLSAKVLGFPKMIIHGMWSKAACIAALLGQDKAGRLSCDVEFKTPIYLPAQVTLCFERTTDGVDFELRDKRDRPHLVGRLSNPPAENSSI